MMLVIKGIDLLQATYSTWKIIRPAYPGYLGFLDPESDEKFIQSKSIFIMKPILLMIVI